MQLTHEVLVDLLALERAGEASADTRALLSHYREHDQVFAQLARESEALPKPEVPEPQLKETEMETFEKTQKALYVKAVVVVATVFGVLAAGVLALGAVMVLLN